LAVYTLNPLHDPRWDRFVGAHPCASVIHSPAWLNALAVTYGFEPIAYTTSPPEAPLSNGVVFCRVASWLTGRRLVSVPFADHCNLLVDTPEDRDELVGALQRTTANERLAYVELRSQDTDILQRPGWQARSSFRLHVLDLQLPLEDLFRATHKTCIQNAIRRAERAKLRYEEGTSDELLRAFYSLLIVTRRRHRIPPQPIEWFRNLRQCLGSRLKIRIAFNEARAIAGIVTLHSGDTMLYKYGCSDAASHNLGGMAFLLWKGIQDAKSLRAQRFDFGRSDADNAGLILFKDRWGSRQSTLTYVRYSVRQPRRSLNDGRGARLAGQLFARLPDEWLTTAGRLLYKHMA
jgi:hypothetical protein